MNRTELKSLLNKIGKRIFVKYVREFGDSSLSNQDMIALLQSRESFKPKASAARTANARRIFRERLEGQALSIIAESGRVEPEVADEARALLTQLRRRLVSIPPQQKMKNIETIKLALQKAAGKRRKMAMFHNQVLLHAELLEHLDPAEFCRDVGVPASYHIEFRKMIAAARTLPELGYSIQKS